MLKNTPCRDAFVAAGERRKLRPLSSGRYKLEDALRELEGIQKTLDAIARHLRVRRRGSRDVPLGGCTSYDMALYLKRLPLALANMLGHDILPGISALAGDDVPPAIVTQLATEATSDADDILARCEEAHARLRSGIKQEYDALRRGTSDLVELLRIAETLAASGLDVSRSWMACSKD